MIAGLTLEGTISLESAARLLETTPRTLQRRLSRRGLCFRALVEQSRFEIAGALLRETDLKVQEIAARIGYSAPGGFARAFTRWAGCSPIAYRCRFQSRTQGAPEWREMGRSIIRPPVAFKKVPDSSEEN